MKEYLLSLIALAFLGGGVLMLAPDGEAKKGIKLLCSLAAVACIILPLAPLLSDRQFDIDGILDRFAYVSESESGYVEIYNSSLTKAELENAEQQLKSQVLSRFSIKLKAFDIKLNAENKSGEYSISSATLILYPSGLSVDPRPICIYLSEQLLCECEVYYDT